MLFTSIILSATLFANTELKVLHNDRTENFSHCIVVRDQRMSDHGGLHYYCPAPRITVPELPTFRPVGDWSYYVTDGLLVWERDSRCGFVESIRSETGGYEKITISCRIPTYPDYSGTIRGPTQDH